MAVGAPAEQPAPLTDIEYKLLLVAYIHAQPPDALNKGKLISTLFAAAGPVGNNPASLPQLLEGLKVGSVREIEEAVNDFALSAKRRLIEALKQTRTSVLNALPPDFPAESREGADVHVRPVVASIARKVQALHRRRARGLDAPGEVLGQSNHADPHERANTKSENANRIPADDPAVSGPLTLSPIASRKPASSSGAHFARGAKVPWTKITTVFIDSAAVRGSFSASRTMRRRSCGCASGRRRSRLRAGRSA